MTETTSTTGGLPTKPALESVSVWVAIVTFVLGLATQFGLPAEMADMLRANAEQLIGAIMTILGVVGAFGAIRRRTLLRF